MTLVLLHGSGTGSYGWKAVVHRLQTAAPRAQVIAPDMLGYGAAPVPSATYTLDEEVTHLKGVLDAHGVGDFHLVTHSIGTMYGLRLRLALLDRVTRLTLVDPLVRCILKEQQEVSSCNEMDVPYHEFLRVWPDPHAAIAAFVDHWNGPGTWDHMGQNTRNLLAGMAPKVYLELREAWNDPMLLADYTAKPPPTRIVLGEKTRLAPRATAKHLARALGANIVTVPDCGHMIPVTHPDAVVRAIVEPV
jgi:pimeloyl-ACP methyl ester carboxylesterase